MILTIIIFVLVLGVFIFVHELGHFITAKRAGVKVEEFGFGLPPRIFGIKKGETIYSINWLPIGGFVKIYGEDGNGKQDNRSFASKSIWQRTKIISAGVLLNYLFAIVAFAVVFAIGVPTVVEDDSMVLKDEAIRVLMIQNNSPAQKAGIQLGDNPIAIKTADGLVILQISSIEQLSEFSRQHQGEKIIMSVKRGDETKDISLALRQATDSEGPAGILLGKTGLVFYPWYEAIWRGAFYAMIVTGQIIIAFGALIKNLALGASTNLSVGGPVYIYQLTGQMTSLGINYLLQFVAFLSLNLAIINFLPFPALDGGRLIFLLIEKIKGSPVKQIIERRVNSVGFIMLVLLMIFITYRDIMRLL